MLGASIPVLPGVAIGLDGISAPSTAAGDFAAAEDPVTVGLRNGELKRPLDGLEVTGVPEDPGAFE